MILYPEEGPALKRGTLSLVASVLGWEIVDQRGVHITQKVHTRVGGIICTEWGKSVGHLLCTYGHIILTAKSVE